mmetsp:Transcript_9659/g.23778  ORF Transcript_9659/g.23778 Transcript_9659/m.23778 type:complete len:523 (-) Transcript_9659:32-1600(-)
MLGRQAIDHHILLLLLAFIPSPVGAGELELFISQHKILQDSIRRIRKPFLPKEIIFLQSSKKRVQNFPNEKKNTGKPPILFIMLPGFAKSPKSYLNITKRIQRQAEERGVVVHAAIGSFFADIPSTLGREEVTDIVEATKSLAKESRANYEKIVLCGHSMGAFMAFDEAPKHDAFVQLGATFNSKGNLRWDGRSLASFPKPVLTMVGERDGFVRYLALADELDDVESLPSEYASIQKPVIAPLDVTHMQAADNVISEDAVKLGRSDLTSGLPLKRAQDIIAGIVADFMVASTTGPETSSVATNLKENVDETQRRLETFRKIRSSEYVEKYLENMQKRVLNIEGDGPTIYPLWHNEKVHFVYSKPQATAEGDVYIHAFPDKDLRFGMGQVSPMLSLKFKSQESVLDVLPGTKAKGPQVKAQALNEETFHEVLRMVTKEERERYLEHGKKLQFLPDKDSGWVTGVDWVNHPLEVVEVDESTRGIRSPVLHSPMEGVPPKFRGMCYMKLLTPAQAYEWIVHDSFK